jgi:uncharacterized protein YxjI
MLLSNRQFFIKERVSLLKLSDTYDIYDPQTQMQVGIAREEPPTWAKFLRLVLSRHFLPTTVRVYEKEGMPALVTLKKQAAFLRVTVIVTDGNEKIVGNFRSKLWSFGGGFFVRDAQENQFAEVKGDWKGWNFRLLDAGGRELGMVTKKWAGIGKELLTSADNYVISLSDALATGTEKTALLLAAGLAIDIVFKEKHS